MNKAVFIDKDGTLINDIPYNINTALITFADGAIEALQRLKNAGYLIIIITNQSGVAYNFFTENDVLKVKDFISEKLAKHDIHLSGFYFCPHHPNGTNKAFAINCDCRKPLPRLILEAAKDFNIDVSSSWMIGDILHDAEAGNRAGCKTILINNGNETEWIAGEYRSPTYLANNLSEAAHYILNHSFK